MHSFTTSLLLFALTSIGVLSQRISTDATCGGSQRNTCLGSAFGNCCSQYGWCGSTKNYCGAGCNPSFGTCTASSASSSSRSSSAARTSSTPLASAQLVSTNARCGPSYGGRTCLGSAFGDCCSQFSYCGKTTAYCDVRTCQKGYGKCNTASSSSSVRSSTPTVKSSSNAQSTSTLSSAVQPAILSISTAASSTPLAASLSDLQAQSSSSQATSSSLSTMLPSSFQAASSSAQAESPSPSLSSPTGLIVSSISQALSSSVGAISSLLPVPSSPSAQAIASTSQAASSSAVAAADAASSTSSSTRLLMASSSASPALSLSTPNAILSPSAQASSLSAFQPGLSSDSGSALVPSMSLTGSPSYTSTTPEFTPSDVSALLVTHTFDDAALPTPVEMGTAPITTGIQKSPPNLVKTCLVVPSKSGNSFTLSDGNDKIPVVKRKDGSLGAIEEPVNPADIENIDDLVFTSYSFAAGDNGLFDIVTKDSPRQYIARKADGSVVLTDRSTGSSDIQLATTIFDVTCEGRVIVRIGTQYYTWVLSGNTLVMAAAEGTPVTMYTIPDLAVSTRRRRNIWQQGAAPRCDLYPQPLEARVFPGARQTPPNQCGADGLNIVEPILAQCCTELSSNYDNCGMTYESANDKFYSCMSLKCKMVASKSSFKTYTACAQGARLYYASASGYVGAKAFYQANTERCKCYCGSPSPDACMINNSLQCLNVLSTDVSNCGACGRTCPSGSRCVDGVCKCPVDQCGDRCVTLASHPRNCGQCGRVAPSGICINGQPWSPPTCSLSEGFSNGNFANGIANWTNPSSATGRVSIYSDSIAQDADKKTVMVGFDRGTNINMKLNTQIRMCPSSEYALKFQVRRPAGLGACNYGVYVAGVLKASGQLPEPLQGGSAWQWVATNVGAYAALSSADVIYKLPDLWATFTLDLTCSGNSLNYVIVDQFSLLPGTVTPSSPQASSVASSEARASPTTPTIASPTTPTRASPTTPTRASPTTPTIASPTTPTAVAAPSVIACTPAQGFTGGHFNQGITGWAANGTGSRLSITMDTSAEDADKLVGTLGVAATARFSTTALLCPNVQYIWEFQIKRSAGAGTCSYVVWVGADVRRYGSLPTYAQGGGTFQWINGVTPGFLAGWPGVTDKGNGQLAVNFWIDFSCEGGAPGSTDGLNYMLMDQFGIWPI